MVAFHGQSPEQPQFHLQKYMSTNSSYKNISEMQVPQKWKLRVMWLSYMKMRKVKYIYLAWQQFLALGFP